MEKVLLDTDVILDFFFDRQPFSEFAAEILLRCENKELEGYVTPVIISNVYYILRKAASHTVIIEKLKALLTIVEVAEMNKSVVLEALNSKFKDFEDGLQNFAAVNQGDIRVILTRNAKDFQNSSLAILSPEMFLKN